MKFIDIEENSIEMNLFPLKWRFTEDKYNVLPEEHIKQLKPLNKIGANYLSDFLNNSELHLDEPFKKNFFNHLDWIEFSENGEEDVKKWLFKKDLPFDKKVYLSWNNDLGMIAPLKLVVEYFDDFFYGMSDDLTVFDESLNWSILFFHEYRIYFGTNDNLKK